MAGALIQPFELIPYRHEPLPTPTSFRLLSVLPDHAGDSEITICGQPLVRCVLKIVDLNDSPDYDALSYTWGNPRVVRDKRYDATQKWPINVNGRLLYVNKNLHQALQHLRHWKPTDIDLDQRREPYNKTLLIEAAEGGHTEKVKRLLRKGASIHCQDVFGETALHYAAENGHVDTVKVLLRNQANTSTIDSTNRTPLECCLQWKRGHWQHVQDLLTGHTPLDEATSAELPEYPQIWIDAICIDQTNVIERNSQVGMMAQIYGHASKVTIWLGVEDRDTHREMDILGRLSHHNDWRNLSMTEQEIVNNMLRRHSWFQRKWVAQELVLAKKVEMYCGKHMIDWELIARVTLLNSHYILVRPGSNIPPARTLKYGIIGRTEAGAWILSQLRSVANLESQLAIRKDLLGNIGEEKLAYLNRKFKNLWNVFNDIKPTLSQLVIMTWALDATDPRDKIFALSSMARSNDPALVITVDYRKPTQQVFLEMGRIFIQPQEDASRGMLGDMMNIVQNDLGPLEGLSFVQPAACARHHLEKGEQPCQNARGWPELPTWVPNFDRNLVDMRFYRTAFDACGAAKYRSYTSDPKLLKVDGLFIDEITMAEDLPSETGHEGCTYAHREPYSVSSWLGMLAAMDPVYITGEHREEVLWRTLIANHVSVPWRSFPWITPRQNADRDDTDLLRRSFKHLLCNALSPLDAKDTSENETTLEILDTLHEINQLETNPSTLLPSRSEIEHHNPEDQDPNQDLHVFAQILALYIHIRALFITERGHLGNGVNTARPGDQIWLLAGVHVPFLLRKVSGTSHRFEFVGEAYVHGLMHGEAAVDRVDDFHPIEIQ